MSDPYPDKSMTKTAVSPTVSTTSIPLVLGVAVLYTLLRMGDELGSNWANSQSSTPYNELLAIDQALEPPVQIVALRGCRGAPVNFRWVFPDGGAANATTGTLLRTRLFALDAQGRPARSASCGALRINVNLGGSARLSSPLEWKDSELPLYIENEVAEVVDAEVRIESPNPDADVLLHSTKVRWEPGPVRDFGLQVRAVGAEVTALGANGSFGTFPTSVVLEVVLSARDKFGNPVRLEDTSNGGLCSGFTLRSSSKAFEFIQPGQHGRFNIDDTGNARVLIRGVQAGAVDFWVERVAGQVLELQNDTALHVEFHDYIVQSIAANRLTGNETLSESDTKWQPLANEVRDAFLHAWSGYKKYAWGSDELKPLTKKGHNTFGNIGMIVLDSLTTLSLMGLTEEFERAAAFVKSDLDFDNADGEVSVFELTIRALGGLLGAHALSGRHIFLERAKELGDRLLPALNSSSGLPWPRWNIARQGMEPTSEPTILAEAGSLQLEFRYLTALTGDTRYRKAVDTCFEAIQVANRPGLIPVHMTPPHVTPPQAARDRVAMGALADSYYEYLLKQWIQSPNEVRFQELWLSVMDELPTLVRPSPELTEWTQTKKPDKLKLIELDEPGGQDIWKMDHLSCFTPGMVALGLMRLPNKLLQKKDRNATWWHMAEGLTTSCAEMWTSTKSGLAPEYVYINPMEPHPIDSVPNGGQHSFLRPETAESLFYLYRLTGNAKYRRLGKKLFHAITKHAKVDAGFASVQDVETVPTKKMDEMQSFVMAETFKYLYLLFSPADTLDLDKYVLNTEGHPLRVIGPW